MVRTPEIKGWVEYAQATSIEEVYGCNTDLDFPCDICYTEKYGNQWLLSNSKLDPHPGGRWAARVCREHGVELGLLW